MPTPATLVPFLLAATFQPVVARQIASPTGETRLETGTLSPPLQGRLEQAVTRYALSRRDALGLPPTSTLSSPEAFGTRFSASFHLRQLVGGVPVYGAKVIVTIDGNRRVVQLGSSVVRYERALTGWTLSMDDALELASRQTEWALRAPNGKPYGGVQRAMFAVGEEVHSGYLVWVPTLDLRHNWYLAIDATNGSVLWTQDRVYHAETDAQVYLSSPGGLNGGVGKTPTQPVTLAHFGPEHAGGGFLFGDQIVMWNCCVNEGCSTAAGAMPKHVQGTTNILGLPVPFDVAICDRIQRATNNPAKHASGDFVYPPVDPPAPSPFASQNEPADTDEFSEVHAFFHVNQVYDFVRGLSTAAKPLFPGETIPPFQTRDEKNGKRLAVWSNALLPSSMELQATVRSGTARAEHLERLDNAAYVPTESFDELLIPQLAFDTDALFAFQGNAADFGYDASDLWHEFGHGVIFATAAFDSFTIDARSGNDEGAALHEAIADFVAAAFGRNPVIGEYVGPRLSMRPGSPDIGLRDLENTFSCPDVLAGEPHQDSQHFSGALWEARQGPFQGQDNGGTFDAAIYAALVSMTPDTDFSRAAAAIANHLKIAFPTMANAEETIGAIFDARGVTNCSKVVDLAGSSGRRPFYGIGGWQQAGLGPGQVVPGPVQMKIHVPEGAKSLTVSGVPAKSQNPSGGGGKVQLFAKSNAPITFTRHGTTLTNDSDRTATLATTGAFLSATVAIDVPCGGDLFFTLGSADPGGDNLNDVAASIEKAGTCQAQMGTSSDAGVVADPATSGSGRVSTGCGCDAVDPWAAAFGLLALVALAPRRDRPSPEGF